MSIPRLVQFGKLPPGNFQQLIESLQREIDYIEKNIGASGGGAGTPGPAGATGATGATGPAGPPGSGLSTALTAYSIALVAGDNPGILFPAGVVAPNAGWKMIEAHMVIGGVQRFYQGLETNKTTTGFDLNVSDTGELVYFFRTDPFTFTVVAGENTIVLPVPMSNANWLMVSAYMVIGGVQRFYQGLETDHTTTTFKLVVSDPGELIYFPAERG